MVKKKRVSTSLKASGPLIPIPSRRSLGHWQFHSLAGPVATTVPASAAAWHPDLNYAPSWRIRPCARGHSGDLAGCWLRDFIPMKSISPFDRRVTALEWHPRNAKLMAVASKTGDVVLWDGQLAEPTQIVKGQGAGYSIGGMKFDPLNDDILYTACMDTPLMEVNLTETGCVRKLLEIRERERYQVWWQSVTATSKLVLGGDTKGRLSAYAKNAECPVFQIRLHKSKINHVEVHSMDENLLVTASTDHTVKIWDLRMRRDDKWQPLFSLLHDAGVNVATLSTTGSSKLLTSDQQSEVRVYQGPSWHSICTIPHPHRQFQHLTPIRASWFPLTDIACIGRYPDPVFPGYDPDEARSIDCFNAVTGKIVAQISHPYVKMIQTISKFNQDGSWLATASGSAILSWSHRSMRKRARFSMGHSGRPSYGNGRDDGDSGNDDGSGDDDFKPKKKQRPLSRIQVKKLDGDTQGSKEKMKTKLRSKEDSMSQRNDAGGENDDGSGNDDFKPKKKQRPLRRILEKKLDGDAEETKEKGKTKSKSKASATSRENDGGSESDGDSKPKRQLKRIGEQKLGGDTECVKEKVKGKRASRVRSQGNDGDRGNDAGSRNDDGGDDDNDSKPDDSKTTQGKIKAKRASGVTSQEINDDKGNGESSENENEDGLKLKKKQKSLRNGNSEKGEEKPKDPSPPRRRSQRPKPWDKNGDV